MFSNDKAFTARKWHGDIKYYTDFKDRVINTAESKGISYILYLTEEVIQPNPITDTYMKFRRDGDIALSIVKSLMGSIPQSRVMDLLDRDDLTSRAKVRRIL